MGIARPVMELHPYAWVFFVPFILLATFTVLNLFIAVIVNTMQTLHDTHHEQEVEEISSVVHAESIELHRDINALRSESRQLHADMRALREEIRRMRDERTPDH